MTVPTVAIMRKKKTAHKRCRPPPWGSLFGGKPLEGHFFIRGEKIENDELLRDLQYWRMHALLQHYGIVPSYPKGLENHSWWCWYQLALTIACELDDSLKIVDGRPPGKTAARWRGAEGAALIRLVDIFRKKNPNRTINWCLQQVQRRILPNSYGRMSLNQLAARYHEAKRHHRTTKQARNSERAS